MITAKRDTEEPTRAVYALSLLESSSYNELQKIEIINQIYAGSCDDVEKIIQDLLLNQVDNWTSYRLKDINRRLDGSLERDR